ncbi:MAG: divalent-cation tolerance protein CutA [Fidelibacterota bacterium]
MKPVLILTTVDDHSLGEKIAKSLVKKKLAACVNLIPNVKSIYRWKGRVIDEEEFLLVIKTTKKCEQPVYQAVGEMHSYELPELITIGDVEAEDQYLKWITSSVDDE